MERQIFFAEKPQPMDLGKKKIVPLNINEEPYIEDGKNKTLKFTNSTGIII